MAKTWQFVESLYTMRYMATVKTARSLSELPSATIRSMIELATSGFGVVVALAWNEFIQKAVRDYLDPYLGKNSGLISMLIYAIIVTVLAVVVTMQLAYLQNRFEVLESKVKTRRPAAPTSTTHSKK